MSCFLNQPMTEDFWTCNWPLPRKKNRTSNFKIKSKIVIVLLQLMTELHFILIFFGLQFQRFQPIICQSFAFQPVAKQRVTQGVCAIELPFLQWHTSEAVRKRRSQIPDALFQGPLPTTSLPSRLFLELPLPPNSTTCWKPTATPKVDQERCVSVSRIQLSTSALRRCKPCICQDKAPGLEITPGKRIPSSLRSFHRPNVEKLSILQSDLNLVVLINLRRKINIRPCSMGIISYK